MRPERVRTKGNTNGVPEEKYLDEEISGDKMVCSRNFTKIMLVVDPLLIAGRSFLGLTL